MMSAGIPALSTAAFIGTLAILAACMSRREPPNSPIAVRQPDTITTSVMNLSFEMFREQANVNAYSFSGSAWTAGRKTSPLKFERKTTLPAPAND
jgi:hypothetical protein